MKKYLIAASLFAAALVATAANKKNDPVLMTIDGQEVRLSEFEYLYNKNNSQQQQPITFDEYVDMFTDYKLKVAEARALGVDTTRSFIREYGNYRRELSLPYLRDKQVEDELVQQAYDRMGREAEVSHIMFAPDRQASDNNKALADSVRNLILTGQITFEDAARQYSIDKASAQRGGLMGWVAGNGHFPWRFEEVCFSTPVGQLSEVVNSGFGYHIVRPERLRKDRGEVNVEHILVLTRGMGPEDTARAKARIDSIYGLATAPGANFAELAKKYSEDPGSARNGGDLGWFGSGRMVAEFDSVSFAIADGEISTPFATSYGYHIVHKKGHRGDSKPDYEKARTQILNQMKKDERDRMPVNATLDKLAKESNSSVSPTLAADVEAFLAGIGAEVCDSAAAAALAHSGIYAYTVDGKAYTIDDVLGHRSLRPGAKAGEAATEAANMAKWDFDVDMYTYALDYLENNNEEYRNLTHEYRDGIMLFDVADANVWGKAAKDKEGQEAYFQANRSNYVWNAPKYKAYVIFAANDSILGEAKNFTAGFDAKTVKHEEFTEAMKAKFGNKVRVERVIAAEGENPITDYLGFGKEKPANTGNSRWVDYFAFGGRVIAAPEEAADVKGLVIADYQTQLEKEWLEHLRASHKVKINKKALKEAKRNETKK